MNNKDHLVGRLTRLGWDCINVLTLPKSFTCSEVDNNVNEEDGVGDAVEHDPAHREVIVEEGDGDRQDDQVRHQQ